MHSRMTLTLKVGILAVVWHMAPLLWKFVQIITKSLEKNGLPSQDHVKPWSLSMALTVEIRVRLLCTTHHYCQHLCQIISKSSDRWNVMDRTQQIPSNSDVDLLLPYMTLILKVGFWVLSTTHHLLYVNICAMYFKHIDGWESYALETK